MWSVRGNFGGLLCCVCVVSDVEVLFFGLWRVVSSLSFVSFLCGLCQMGLLD